MACYYIVISSTHLSNGHFRNIKGVFRGPLCKNGNKALDYAEKEKAIAKALEDLKANFYCELCDKQYYKHQEFDNHINSYDHAHKQRLKELKQREFARNVASKSRKDEKKQEKALKRLYELAELRKQVGCAPGSGPMFKSTTVAVANASRENQRRASMDPGRASTKSTDPETGIAGSIVEISGGSSILSPRNTTDIWKTQHCKQGKQSCGQRIGFSFSFPKKVPVKLESSAAVFCENSEEGPNRKSVNHKRKVNCNAYNTPMGSGTEAVVGLQAKTEKGKNQQEISIASNGMELVKESQDLTVKARSPAGEPYLYSYSSGLQCNNKPKLPLLAFLPLAEQGQLHESMNKEETSSESDVKTAQSKCFDSVEETNEIYNILSNESLKSLVKVKACKLSQAGNVTEELPCSVFKCCSLQAQTENMGTSCACKRPTSPFFPVLSKDGSTVLQWPSEMLLSTNTQPSITYCCNPLYFDFRSPRTKEGIEEVISEESELMEFKTPVEDLSSLEAGVEKELACSLLDTPQDCSNFDADGTVTGNEVDQTVQKHDCERTQFIANTLKAHCEGSNLHESIHQMLSYCKSKKHKKACRHSNRNHRRKEIEKESLKNWKVGNTHCCKEQNMRKASLEWKNREKVKVDENFSSSGMNELSDEENITDASKCRRGQEQTMQKMSVSCTEYFEVQCGENKEVTEKLDKNLKKIACGNRAKRDTLKSKHRQVVHSKNYETRKQRESIENDGEHENSFTDSVRKICGQQHCSLSRTSRDMHSAYSQACSYKSRQRGRDIGPDSLSDTDTDTGPYNAERQSVKRGYSSLNGETIIPHHKHKRHRHSSSSNKEHRQSPNSCYRSFYSDYIQSLGKESPLPKKEQSHSNKSKTKISAREKSRCLTPDEFQHCDPSCQKKLLGDSEPNAQRQDKNIRNISHTPVEQTEEGHSSVHTPSTETFADDYHSEISNHLLNSKMTMSGHECDERTNNPKYPSEDILFPGLSFVLRDASVKLHSEEVSTVKTLPQGDAIYHKEMDSYSNNVTDVETSLNEVHVRHYETLSEERAGRTERLRVAPNVVPSNSHRASQTEAPESTDCEQPQTEQIHKAFSPLSQTISFTPEEAEKYKQLQIQAQQHIEQQRLVSKVKGALPAPAITAALAPQQPIHLQQSVTTASITTIHHTILQRHAAAAAGSFIQPHSPSLPHIHALPTHISLAPGLYPGGHPAFLAAPQLHIIPARVLHPEHFALHPLPIARLFPPLVTLHSPAIPLHPLLHPSFAGQDFLYLTGQSK
eukprot:gi/632946136/ref/XP_007888408.1/ PREDICTED: zinc finger protein 804A [Callorhinchus milii]